MRVSRIMLLVVALFAGGLAAFLAMRSGGEPQVAPAEPTIVQEARAQILVAKTPIGIGERLSQENMQWQDWPENAVQGSYVTIAAAPEALTEMKDAVARFEFFPGEPIRQEKLVHSDQGYLSAVLSSGMRGISISVTADSASGGFIVPNDHVDVILTRTTASGQLSETILSNVRVLAINARLGEVGATGGDGAAPPDDGSGTGKQEVFSNVAIATLELDPGQGEALINAGQLGKLSLALRSIVDFDAPQGVGPDQQRNQPIKLIRSGQETSVMAGTVSNGSAGTGANVDAVALSQPPVTVGVTPSVIQN